MPPRKDSNSRQDSPISKGIWTPALWFKEKLSDPYFVANANRVAGYGFEHAKILAQENSAYRTAQIVREVAKAPGKGIGTELAGFNLRLFGVKIPLLGLPVVLDTTLYTRSFNRDSHPLATSVLQGAVAAVPDASMLNFVNIVRNAQMRTGAGFWPTLRSITATHGIRGLTSGAMPLGLKLCYSWSLLYGSDTALHRDNKKASWSDMGFYTVGSSFAYTIATNPFDLWITQRNRHIKNPIKYIRREFGVMGAFTRGAFYRMLHKVPSTAIALLLADDIRQRMRDEDSTATSAPLTPLRMKSARKAPVFQPSPEDEILAPPSVAPGKKSPRK